MSAKKRSTPEFKASSERFGAMIRHARKRLAADDRRRFSLRAIAGRLELEPSYLSRIERGIEPPPSEKVIIAMARELNYDPDELLLLAGRISSAMVEIFTRRPSLHISLLRNLQQLGEWEIVEGLRRMLDKAGKAPVAPIPDRFGRLLPPGKGECPGAGTGEPDSPKILPSPEVEGQSRCDRLCVSCQRCGALNAVPPPDPERKPFVFVCHGCGSGNSFEL